MSISLSDELTVLLCVLGVILFIVSILMVFFCLDCIRQRGDAQQEGTDNIHFPWLSFLQKSEETRRNIFNVKKEKEQPPTALASETYVLSESIKSSHVDLVPQNKVLYKSIAQDSDSESQFSFTSEPDSRRSHNFAALDATSCGTIVCSIKFYHFANRLAVRVGEVQLNLLDNIVVNPYVKLHLLPEYRRGNRQTTRVKRNSTLLVCDEDFLFGVGSREVRTKSLSLQLFDYKSNTRHLCIGKVNINLGDYNFKDEDKPLSIKRHIIPYRDPQVRVQWLCLAIRCVFVLIVIVCGLVSAGEIPGRFNGGMYPPIPTPNSNI